MTSSELYDLLLLDVVTFNDWRVKNAEITINFEGYDFSDCQLTDVVMVNVNLKNANFKGANIEYASFCHSDVSGANFEGAIAGGAHFGSIENSDVRLPQAFIAHLSFAAVVNNSNFKGADLELANFRNCDCKGVCFDDANTDSVLW